MKTCLNLAVLALLAFTLPSCDESQTEETTVVETDEIVTDSVPVIETPVETPVDTTSVEIK